MNKGLCVYCGDTTFPHAPMVKLPADEVTVSMPEELEKCTRNQSENPDWYKNRTNRITVSQMHSVMKDRQI